MEDNARPDSKTKNNLDDGSDRSSSNGKRNCVPLRPNTQHGMAAVEALDHANRASRYGSNSRDGNGTSPGVYAPSAADNPAEVMEVGTLVQETKRVYEAAMHDLQFKGHVPFEQAHELATRPAADGVVQKMLAKGPEEVTWQNLSLLMHTNPSLALEKWQTLKAAVEMEIKSGYAAAKAVESAQSCSPYDRAAFLALRQSFHESWKPQNAIEENLLDQLVQTYTLKMQWMERLMQVSSGEGIMAEILAEATDEASRNYRGAIHPMGDQGHSSARAQQRRRGSSPATHRNPHLPEPWAEPRLSQVQAIELATQMVERFDRAYMRQLRNLRDMRRFMPMAPSVTINNPKQVNVGQQQINLAGEVETPVPDG